MKKLLIITLLLAGTATAETKLTFEEYNAINPNNQKPSIQMKARQAMKRIAKVDAREAGEIAQEHCEESGTMNLRQKGWYLVYASDSCDIRVNALDGSVL